jgi:hypothetical protein
MSCLLQAKKQCDEMFWTKNSPMMSAKIAPTKVNFLPKKFFVENDLIILTKSGRKFSLTKVNFKAG